MDREVFVDTSYAIALANANDQFHAKAIFFFADCALISANRS